MKLIRSVAIGVTLWSTAAFPADFAGGAITVSNPWTRATPRGAEVAGGYMMITNKGASADRLIGGSFASAGRFEVHSMDVDNGMARMRPVEGGLEIKPGEAVELKPSSFHAMLMGLREPLQAGQHVKGTLMFEKAGQIEIEYDVLPIGSTNRPPH